MNGPSDKFLTGSSFTLNQNSRIRRTHLVNLAQHLLARATAAKNFSEIVEVADLLLQVRRLAGECADFSLGFDLVANIAQNHCISAFGAKLKTRQTRFRWKSFACAAPLQPSRNPQVSVRMILELTRQ